MPVTKQLDLFQWAPVYRATLKGLADMGAPPSAKLAFIGLRSFVRKPGVWWQVAHKTLSIAAGLAYSTLRAGIAWLRDRKVIEVQHTQRSDGSQGPNKYRILWWPESERPTPQPSPTPKKAPTPKPAPPRRQARKQRREAQADTEALGAWLSDTITAWGEAATEEQAQEQRAALDAARYAVEAAASPTGWTPPPEVLAEAQATLQRPPDPPPPIDPWQELRAGNRSLTAWIAAHLEAHPLWVGTRRRTIAAVLRQLALSPD